MTTMNRLKKYAAVGAGSRVTVFLDAIAGTYRGTTELVGLCDVSPTRMAWHNRRREQKFSQRPVPTYLSGDFDRMVLENRPDVVVVASVDATHHHYIIRAMELGCDVVCEKPMTIDAAKARAIFDAIERTGRHLRIAFNYRYTPLVTKVREVIQSGAIGVPLAADLRWMLNTSHGADYFRRWHAEKDKSGGLLLHKSTHHFDMINWWIASYPKTVFAMGDLKFYGRRAAEARGQKVAYDRSLNAPKDDPFRLKWEERPEERELYNGAAEQESGYIRDRNVFGDHVTIEDTIGITARYRNGVIFTYSLVAYSPWEGYVASITGTKGRLDIYNNQGAHVLDGKDNSVLGAPGGGGWQSASRITLMPMFHEAADVPIPEAQGAHEGADELLLQDIFSVNPPPDPFGRSATHIDGAASCLLGIAANESMSTGKLIDVDDLLRLPA